MRLNKNGIVIFLALVAILVLNLGKCFAAESELPNEACKDLSSYAPYGNPIINASTAKTSIMEFSVTEGTWHDFNWNDLCVVSALGYGDHGATLLVRKKDEADTDRRYALKIYHGVTMSHDIEREMRINKFLQDSPGVTTLHSVFYADRSPDIPVMFIQDLNETTLSKRYYSSFEAISFEEITSQVLDLLQAVLAMHEKGVVHNDLSINNVMLDKKNHIKFIDFTYAQFIDESHEACPVCGDLSDAVKLSKIMASDNIERGCEASSAHNEFWNQIDRLEEVDENISYEDYVILMRDAIKKLSRLHRT